MRGSATDVLYMAIFITVIPIVFIMAYHILSAMSGTILNSEGMITYGMTALQNWDSIFILVFFAFGGITVALASRISAHPVFLGFAIFVYAMIVMFITQISNIYFGFADSPALTASFAAFPYVAMIHENLAVISTVLLFLVGVVMYGKGGVKTSE